MSTEADPKEKEDGEDSIDTKITLATRAQLKRELKPVLEQLASLKALSETVANLAKTVEAKPAEDKADKKADKVDPQLKLLQDQIAQLTKRNQENEDKARALEQKSRRDYVRGQLRDALESKGIKGARAAALISHLEATAVKDDGETISFSTVRSRSKNAPLEEMSFENIREGIEDWAKTPDAAEFLPAPTAPAKAAQGHAAPHQVVTRQVQTAKTDADMARNTARQLEAMGVNINEIL